MGDQIKINQTTNGPIPNLPTFSELPVDSDIVTTNALGRKLLDIRNRAIQKGMRLKSLDEILTDIADGRKNI